MILLTKNDVSVMSSDERIASLHNIIQDVYQNSIKGDFVECGIYKGGNMIIAKTFFESVNNYRTFYGYDTFAGMTEPSLKDGNKARKSWNNKAKCEASIEEVKNEFNKRNILDDSVKFIVGDVRETLLNLDNLPKEISVLRLDTDFYESTLIELQILYPRLVEGGWLIIDDYGHWTGCRTAVNEYFGEDFVQDQFTKIDYTAIVYKKRKNNENTNTQ